MHSRFIDNKFVTCTQHLQEFILSWKRLLRLLPLSVTKWGTQLSITSTIGIYNIFHWKNMRKKCPVSTTHPLLTVPLHPSLTGLRCESPSQHLLHWSTNQQCCEQATNHNAQHLKEHNWISLYPKQSFRRIHSPLSPLSPLDEWMSMSISIDVHDVSSINLLGFFILSEEKNFAAWLPSNRCRPICRHGSQRFKRSTSCEVGRIFFGLTLKWFC